MPDRSRLPGGSLRDPGDRIIVDIFGDAVSIAGSLGLDLDLPDCNNVDPDYWEAVHANGGYKVRIAARIADPWLDGDPDWAKLQQLPWGEVWFDIEEGIKLFMMSRDFEQALSLIESLHRQGIPLMSDDSESLVWVKPQIMDDDVLLRVGARLEASGLVPLKNGIVWTLPSDYERPTQNEQETTC